MPLLKEQRRNSHLPVCSSQSPPNPGVSPSAPPHSSAEICPASPTAAICQRVFSSNHIKPRGKEPAQIILCLASLKAPHWSQSKCPVAVPGLSPENMVCRAHSFAIRLMCWHISPGQMQAASREAAAGLTRANVPWRNKQDEKKLQSELLLWSPGAEISLTFKLTCTHLLSSQETRAAHGSCRAPGCQICWLA